VFLWTSASRKGEKAKVHAQSGPDGSFQLNVPAGDLKRGATIVATGPGLGLDWVELAKKPDGELTLRPPKDDVPIQGRVLDLEGRAVAGAVLEVTGLQRWPDGDLTPYVEAHKNAGDSPPNLPRLPHLSAAALEGPTTATTDAEGRFRLGGFGRERIVLLALRGKEIERRFLTVLTRAGIASPAKGWMFGPSFDLLVGPGKVIEGVVTEKGTGKPVAGVRVYGGMSDARTDKEGRYRLEGVGKRDHYHLSADGRPNYFSQMARQVADSPGLESIRVDFVLDRGTVLHGQVRDKATGKPVAGVVQYYAKGDNPHLKEYAAQGMGERVWAGPDGKFRILAIPGPGYLAVQAAPNRFARAVVPGWDGNGLATAPHYLFPHEYHAIVAINPAANEPETLRSTIDLVPGSTRAGKVVGPDGQPVTDVIAFGLTAIPDPGARTYPRPEIFGPPPSARLKTADFTVVGLNPDQPRYLVFIHPEKKLGKVLQVRGDEAGDLTVRLEPLGAIRGRVPGGAGLVVTPQPPLHFAFYKDYPIELVHQVYGEHRLTPRIPWLPETVKTDAEGKFQMEGLLPGLPYGLLVTDGPLAGGVMPSHSLRDIVVEAGKTRDVGDLPSGSGFGR
jgi:hypothetical protein